jgi:hypothetical protein
MWAESEDIAQFNDEAAAAAAVDWARAYASTNLLSVIENAGDKAANYAKKPQHYDALCGLALAHMLHGRGAEALLAACDEDFESVFGHAPLTVPQPVKRARKLRGVPAVERAQMRARVAIETMCALPVDPAALVGLMSVLRSHALRQCLPDLPPAAGAPPATTKKWSAVLADQGPF